MDNESWVSIIFYTTWIRLLTNMEEIENWVSSYFIWVGWMEDDHQTQTSMANLPALAVWCKHLSNEAETDDVADVNSVQCPVLPCQDVAGEGRHHHHQIHHVYRGNSQDLYYMRWRCTDYCACVEWSCLTNRALPRTIYWAATLPENGQPSTMLPHSALYPTSGVLDYYWAI